ncbi:MAG: sugar phosphate isomerase/epimerase [Proteobacteria bacterium]|nr:sugar phosphate isomerase/epimerase [Pseudomonadota bacterium]
MYTVRDDMAEDVAGTLRALAAIGYAEVEFAGFFGHSPGEIRALLDTAGLVSPSAHVQLADIRSAAEQLIETAVTIGNDYIVLGWLAPDERLSLDDYRRHIDLVAGFAAQCRDAGLQFAWHNHDFEFTELDGQRPIDLILDRTDSELVQVELDLYWMTLAGADPFHYFENYPGRFPLCHIKDMAADRSMTDVGDGIIDFAGFFAVGDLAGFKHYYVERDDAKDALGSAARSYAAVSTLTF